MIGMWRGTKFTLRIGRGGGGIFQQTQKDGGLGEPVTEGIRPKRQSNGESLRQFFGKVLNCLEVTGTLCPKMIAEGFGPLNGSKYCAAPLAMIRRDRLHHHKRLGLVGVGRCFYRRRDRLACAFPDVAPMKSIDRDGFFILLG